MTHGQELVTDGYDPANTEKCYAKKIFDEFDDVFDELLKPSLEPLPEAEGENVDAEMGDAEAPLAV